MPESPVNRLDPHWPQPADPTSLRDDSSWGEIAKAWEEDLERFLGDHPKLTLATAATIGLFLGWLVKRK
jgi:ElaB/YqjD/DUF883 family membrane-anchored ribosome-binding protein